MAKVQAKKKAATAARRATTKVAARVKTAARAVSKKAKAASTARPARKAVKVVAKAAKAVKAAATKPSKVVSAPAKAMKKAVAALPARPVAVPPPAGKAPIAPRAAVVPDALKKTRARRARPRVHSDGAPVAAWLPQGEKPRPSSFIPAPPRAEAPSLIAAPPASSDRLIRPEDVTEFVTRTVPIRVDVEQGAGHVFVSVNPEEVTLRAGEGIEWDFRYLGGADVIADELVIEFEKPAPFATVVFKSRKPGTARPHRQLSGPAQKNAAGKRVQYTIRAMTPFKTELFVSRLWLTVTA